jgi:hypothetical protein
MISRQIFEALFRAVFSFQVVNHLRAAAVPLLRGYSRRPQAERPFKDHSPEHRDHCNEGNVMKASNGWTRLARRGAVALAAASVFGLVGCSGAVGNGTGPSGGGGTGTGPTGGSGGTPGGKPSDVSGPIVGLPAPSSRLVRLNSKQWENTVKDLLHLSAPLGYSSNFVTEPLQTSFDTNGSVLTIESNQWSGYKRAALDVAKKVSRDPQLLAVVAPPAADAAARARSFIRDFGLRTFRRPLTDADITRYNDLFTKGATLLATGDAFADGVEMVLRAFFQSPNFLYRIETSDTVNGGKIPLGDYEIASRLSYSLTNSTPDDTLLSAASAKMLQSRDNVLTQAQRLIASPAGQTTVSDFHYQLLHLENDVQIMKDPARAPAFTADLNASLKDETLTFVKDVIFGQSKGIAELLSAPYTFANSKVAKVYGMTVNAPAAGQPDPFVKLNLDPTQRAGILTQAGFLSFYADQQTPSIILRGVRIAQDVLCVDIPPPPNTIPPLADLAPNSTNRKRVENQTKDAPCNTCHTTLINPLGFALENLDGFAQFRTQENGQPIDATAKYTLDGKEVSFNGAVELMKAVSQSQQANDCYSRHLAEYLYGRKIDSTNDADASLITQAGARSKAYPSAKDLMVKLVTADEFLNRAP